MIVYHFRLKESEALSKSNLCDNSSWLILRASRKAFIRLPKEVSIKTISWFLFMISYVALLIKYML